VRLEPLELPEKPGRLELPENLGRLELREKLELPELLEKRGRLGLLVLLANPARLAVKA
jgi:hypothetical protein